jgi:hypothetical protein
MAFQTGSQNDLLLERLKEGPVTNWHISHNMGILKYTSRISQIRAAGIKKWMDTGCGWDVIAKNINGGTWQYTLEMLND